MGRSSRLIQAAVVVNSLPKKQAAQLLARLEPGDLKSVMDAVTRLDDVSAEQISDCLNKLAEDAERWTLVESKDSTPELQEAKKQLDSALALTAKKANWQAESSQPFAFLLETIPVIRDHVLADEHPRNIAIVLSCFPPDTASQCMKGLEENLRISVVKRLCEIDEIQEEEIQTLSYALRMRLNKLLNSRSAKTIGVESAAQMLSCADPKMRESLLVHVSQTDPDLAYKLQRSVFKIERLLTLEDVEIRKILKNVDTACWAPALKNAPQELVKKITENMGQDPQRILTQEIDEIGLVNEEDQDLARNQIIQVVLRLAREGKIELRKNGPRISAPNLRNEDGMESGQVYEIV